MDGRPLSIHYFTLDTMEYIAGQAVDRTDHWIWAINSLPLKILREGKILYDPSGKLRELKSIAIKWKWEKRDLYNALATAYENLEKAMTTDDPIDSRIYIEKTMDAVIVLRIMKNNDIPSPHPNDMYSHAMKHKLLSIYREAHLINKISLFDLIHLSTKLRSYMNREEYESMLRDQIKYVKRKKYGVAYLSLKKHYMDYLASKPPRIYYNPYDGKEITILIKRSSPDIIASIYPVVNTDNKYILDKLYGVLKMFSEKIIHYQ